MRYHKIFILKAHYHFPINRDENGYLIGFAQDTTNDFSVALKHFMWQRTLNSIASRARDLHVVERILSTTRLRNNVIDIKLLLFTALVDANNPDDEVWIADRCVEYGSHEVYVFGLQAAVLTSTSRHTGSSMIAPNQLS